MAEALRDPGAVEIGHRDGLRWTIGLVAAPRADGVAGTALGRETVFVVTGAAGGIVSAIIGDLARASGGVFYLLDKVPEPDEANPDLERFARDRDGLKRELFERLKARGERATPAMVERELAGLERARAALDAIRAVRGAGGTVHYCSVDLTDAAAVARVMADVRARSGRIDVLLHAAGIEISHLLPDKDPREFDLVFDVKSDGWFNLLRCAGDLPVGAAVAFSSIAGRFGNGGQADYSAANDLLCKTVSSLRRTRPATRAVAIDWTAWAGIGMAARGSIPKMMELAGIDMLPPEVGIPVVRQELTAPSGAGEVVVAGRLGVLLQEWDDSGGLDPAAVASGSPRPHDRHARAGVGRPRAWSSRRRSFRVSSRFSTTIASTERRCCPVSWGSKRSPSSRRSSCRGGTSRRSSRSTSWRRSSSTATSRARSSSAALLHPDGADDHCRVRAARQQDTAEPAASHRSRRTSAPACGCPAHLLPAPGPRRRTRRTAAR